MKLTRGRGSEQPSQGLWDNWLRVYGPVLGAYLLVTWFTNAHTMGDTFDYANAILAYQHGSTPDLTNPFWDFGHLFWRPLGWLFFRASRPLSNWWVGPDEFAQATLALCMLSWASGLTGVVLMRAFVGLTMSYNWVANLVTLALVVSNAFLNYAQTGSSYIPGLAFLLAGCYVLARKRGESARTAKTALIAATSLVIAVCFWLPYILAIPVALALPLLTSGFQKSRRKVVIQTALGAAVGIALAYLAVSVVQGIYSFPALARWASSSAHGYHRSGLLRTMFGLARSFIDMGNDGVLFKRYLLHDPFSPVSFWELFRFSLWKLSLFYVFLVSLLGNLLLSNRGRTYCWLLLVNAIPVLIFALFVFEGGMPERYLPLYPAVFLSLAHFLDSRRSQLALLAVPIAFIVTMSVSNISSAAKTSLDKREAAGTVRIRELLPELNSQSFVAVSHLQDELVSFSHDFPFNPINREGKLNIYSVVEIGAQRMDTWRQDFASQTLAAWHLEGTVWVSRRLLSSAPRPEWNWVEGDDPRVSWKDLQTFFAQLETGRTIGGSDGFVNILPSAENKRVFGNFAGATKTVKCVFAVC